jgi:hypothetical protein
VAWRLLEIDTSDFHRESSIQLTAERVLKCVSGFTEIALYPAQKPSL